MLLVGDPHMDKCFGWWCSYGSCSLPQIVTSKWVACHHQTRIRISVRRFTPANTGLDKPSTYPELGSSFKASLWRVPCGSLPKLPWKSRRNILMKFCFIQKVLIWCWLGIWTGSQNLSWSMVGYWGYWIQLFAKSQFTTLGFNAASDCDLPLLYLCSFFSDGSLWYLVHRDWWYGRLVGHSETF